MRIERLYKKYHSDEIKEEIISTLTKCKDDVNIPVWQKKRIEDLLVKITLEENEQRIPNGSPEEESPNL